MKNAQKPDHISLNTLINRLKEGRYVIPDFQREFEWSARDVKDLMRSIFLDYYIGSLLLWKGKKENFDALSCEILYGFDNQKEHHAWTYDKGTPEYIILDGQQRLTAIYYAFVGPDVPLPGRSNRAVFFIKVDKFMEEIYDEAFQYDWLYRRVERIMHNREKQYEEHIFPLSIVGAGGWELANWVKGYEEYWRNEAEKADADGNVAEAEKDRRYEKNAKEFGLYLKELTEEYQIAYIELDRELEVDKVCDIFTQINSKGIRLDVFDLINALLKPKGLQLKHMWRKAKPSLKFAESEKMNVYILQVMSILKQNYCSPKYLYYLLPGQEKQVRDSDGTRRKEILISNTTEFQNLWEKAVVSIEKALKLIKHPQEYGAISPKYIPYVSILPVFAALQAHVETIPHTKMLDAQRKIQHWYWSSIFTNRYSGSVESTSAKDFIEVREWIEDDKAEPASILEFRNRFKNLDLRKETKRGTSVYNGIFNLLVLQGARDWRTGAAPQFGDLDDHHIVPASWCETNLDGDIGNTILNRTPLTAETNRHVINNTLPNEYLPQLIKNNGEAAVRAMLDTHFISAKAQEILMRKPFTKEDFDDFITERQKTLQNAIENLLIKERIVLPPIFRELDAKLEETELEIREIIKQILTASGETIPPHIDKKIIERTQRAARKNAAFDTEYYSTLEGKLEYCDLRELQDIILNKGLWDKFSNIYGNKETLARKFDQLAELRNGIRHSRTVDDVTRKEGEAAIEWFKQVHKKVNNGYGTHTTEELGDE